MRQKLGQHFLTDNRVVEAMLSAVPSRGDCIFVEVGPGTGVMTDKLVERGDNVLAIEWDPILASNLTKRYAGKSVAIVQADIRTFNLIEYLSKNFGHTNYCLVANLPYYLSSFFIRTVFATWPVLPQKMALLVQAEVAHRLSAKAGDSERSVLSVLAQSYAEPQIILRVPPASFNPPPKVDSAVVSFGKISNEFFANLDQKQFFRVVKAGFGAKRKTILNSLAGGLRLEKESCDKMLSQAEINSGLRAQDLSIEQWGRLTRSSEEK